MILSAIGEENYSKALFLNKEIVSNILGLYHNSVLTQ